MQEDSLKYDSLAIRPLPKWLINQKEGLTAYKPPEIILREDNSLDVAFAITGLIVILSVILLTIYIKRKKGNHI